MGEALSGDPHYGANGVRRQHIPAVYGAPHYVDPFEPPLCRLVFQRDQKWGLPVCSGMVGGSEKQDQVKLFKHSDINGILSFPGCWTAGPRGMVTGQSYPKPSVSVSPEVVTLGGKVTVRCSTTMYPGAKFFLQRSDSYVMLTPNTTKKYEAEFIISNIQISDAGIYYCWYGFQDSSATWYSHASDAVHINVTDPACRALHQR
uniref:Uncharacterized protein n=1 Tax=Sphaerodactylus townsendi TaxID=933632 RepID=A0ACB8EW61_9SAUR